MMSQSNEETLSQIKQATPSKIRFTDEAGPSADPSAPVTSSTLGTDTTTVTTPSSDELYTDAFNFSLSKNFSSTVMAHSLTSKDAKPKEVRDYVMTENEDRCRQISPFIHSFLKDLHVKNGCVCIDDKLPSPTPSRRRM